MSVSGRVYIVGLVDRPLYDCNKTYKKVEFKISFGVFEDYYSLSTTFDRRLIPYVGTVPVVGIPRILQYFTNSDKFEYTIIRFT